jgi:hypothetical protein
MPYRRSSHEVAWNMFDVKLGDVYKHMKCAGILKVDEIGAYV